MRPLPFPLLSAPLGSSNSLPPCCTQLPSRLLRCAFRFVVLSPPLLLSVQNGRAEPALLKVQRFSGLVTANEHKDQPSSSYRQDAADQNQFSWHKFSCRLC